MANHVPVQLKQSFNGLWSEISNVDKQYLSIMLHDNLIQYQIETIHSHECMVDESRDRISINIET